jgi:hypothetical protein
MLVFPNHHSFFCDSARFLQAHHELMLLGGSRRSGLSTFELTNETSNTLELLLSDKRMKEHAANFPRINIRPESLRRCHCVPDFRKGAKGPAAYLCGPREDCDARCGAMAMRPHDCSVHCDARRWPPAPVLRKSRLQIWAQVQDSKGSFLHRSARKARWRACHRSPSTQYSSDYQSNPQRGRHCSDYDSREQTCRWQQQCLNLHEAHKPWLLRKRRQTCSWWTHARGGVAEKHTSDDSN